MKEHTIVTLRSLLEADAKDRQLLRLLNSNRTASNLVALLASLRRSNKGLMAVGNWSMGPHEAFLFNRNDGKMMGHFSGNTSPQYITDRRGEEVIKYRPITRGIHSRLTRQEVDELVAKNKVEMPYRVLTIEPIPDNFLHL